MYINEFKYKFISILYKYRTNKKTIVLYRFLMAHFFLKLFNM